MRKFVIIVFIMGFIFSSVFYSEGIRAAADTTAAGNNELSTTDNNSVDNSGDNTVGNKKSSVDESNNLKEVSSPDTLLIKTGSLEKKDGKSIVTNGITMIKGDIEITAEEAFYYEDEKRAEIDGNVNLIHDKGKINSDSMKAWLNDDRYIFNDNVKMLQELDDGQFNLESPFLELMKADDSFTAKEGVKITYNGRILKGDEVVYNDQEETLELTTNVYIEEDNGDWVKSNHAIFHLDTEEFNADGDVELKVDISQ